MRKLDPSEWEHGTVNTYKWHKCRCDRCRRAVADEKTARQRARIAAFDASAHEHGDWRTYNRGCRCAPCRSASSARQREQRAERIKRFDPSDPSVQHGRHSSYVLGCRCDMCKSANSDARKKSVYGLLPGQYDDAVKSRNGNCDICGPTDKKLMVDHDHASGEVRGLLCNNCNTALGKFMDDVGLLLAAIRYLQDPPGIAVE